MSNNKAHIGYVRHKGVAQSIVIGLPFAMGCFHKEKHSIVFYLEDDLINSCEAHIVTKWNDGSAKWLHLEFICEGNGKLYYDIQKNLENSNVTKVYDKLDNQFSTMDSLNKQAPQNVKIEGTLSTNPSNQFSIVVDSLPITFNPQISFKGNKDNISFDIKSMLFKKTKLSNQYCVCYELEFEGKLLLLELNIKHILATQSVDISVRIHNPAAAEHLNNTWDLGDKNSFFIDKFDLLILQNNSLASISVIDQIDNSEQSARHFYNAPFLLKQQGSGGENWQSPIHWDENKETTVQEQGYILNSGTDHQTISGFRASPYVALSNADNVIVIHMDEFWQNFPISIESLQSGVRFGLFHDRTELQGGESKSWNIHASFFSSSESVEKLIEKSSSSNATFNWCTHYLNRTSVFGHLSFSESESDLSSLIKLGIEGEFNFFNKREQIDVFGWRNFGELYADHEIPEKFDGQYFVSHYNNQYDPIFGFTLQYLRSKDVKWKQLVSPLSRHVQDIDVYDTEYDKGEYNGGLMWHTDHYLPAETCTHRSNSKHHSYAYDGFLGGGGPGGQHCYTTGLLWQYLFFADDMAKRKVLQLTDWVRRFYNGSGSLLERTFRLLTIDLKNEQLTMVGITRFGNKYPLDRGTGNFLIALLDSYEITQNANLLQESAFVIKNTVHPSDDLQKRQLYDVENAWFYTVFFQAVVRFLFLKESIHQLDKDYMYARYTFIHYSQWMLENEQYYLNKPEILEFPNDTWCAQDIRKANLLYYGYYFSEDKNKGFIEKADKFYEYIRNHLQQSNEKQHTRVLAILMQNDGVVQKFQHINEEKRILPHSSVVLEQQDFGNAPEFSKAKILTMYLKDMSKLLLKFSVKKEWNWLKFRINKITNR